MNACLLTKKNIKCNLCGDLIHKGAEHYHSSDGKINCVECQARVVLGISNFMDMIKNTKK